MRAGTIFAHDQKQYRRWLSKKDPGARKRSLTGAALEKAVMRTKVIRQTISAAEWARHRAEVAATQLVPHPAGMLR